MEFVELVFLIKHDVTGLTLNTTDRILSLLIQSWYEMALKLLFEYGEHESTLVAQMPNVVPWFQC